MLNNKRGIAFFLVFVLIAFTTAIIMALGIQVQNQAHIIKVMEEKEIAFLIAQAGLKAMYYEEQKSNWSWFTHKPDESLPDTPPVPRIALDPALPLELPSIEGVVAGSYTAGATGNYIDNIMGGSFAVRARQDPDDNAIITIESTGTYNSQSIKLKTVYERVLFNKYFLFTDSNYDYLGGPTLEIDAGRGNFYVGGYLRLASGACYWALPCPYRLIIDCTGDISAKRIYGVSCADVSLQGTLDSMEAVVAGDPTHPWADPANRRDTLLRYPAGKVIINGMEFPIGDIGEAGSCSNPWNSDYAIPNIWMVDNKDLLRDPFDGSLPLELQGEDGLNAWKQQRLDNYNTFIQNYNSFTGLDNIHTEGAVSTVEPPSYTTLVEGACIHIVDPGVDPGIGGDNIVSDILDIPGAIAGGTLTGRTSLYNPMYCFREDNWDDYPSYVADPDAPNNIVNRYARQYRGIPDTPTDLSNWRDANEGFHDGSPVGNPAEVIVIDVTTMVNSGDLPDNSIIYSEQPVFLLGEDSVDMTFTLICDEDIYIQGNFNTIDSKSITLMTRKRGFIVSESFVLSDYTTDYLPGTHLEGTPDGAGGFDSVSRISGIHSFPTEATSTVQSALFIGTWGITDMIEHWAAGATHEMRGAFIKLPAAEQSSLIPQVRGQESDYNRGSWGSYCDWPSGGRTTNYNDAFYDRPCAGQIGGNKLLEWKILR